MENAEEFERWLDRMLRDAKEQLGMTDATIAHVLFREGLAHYLRTLGKQGLNNESIRHEK